MDWITDPAIWASLLTLIALEVVLGIDNVVFMSIIAGRLPVHQQPAARRIGIVAALGLRIVFLSAIAWIMGLTKPIITVMELGISWRDIILLSGGVFLIYKSTREIHDSVEGEEEEEHRSTTPSFAAVVAQIVILDLVFSIDSVVTAVGMAEHLWVMITAVTVSMLIMLIAAGTIADFIQRHPTTKMLALSFLMLIGASLVADGLHVHIPRGYIYFAVVFSAAVEVLNLVAKRRRRSW
ncbi:MAG: TerC family protein [Rhodospirillaceae bacterium]|nr:TerC family protein [Rhodospirillaceae bacterium]MBT6139967.1 TerC family protein [Rhodospirillaceae bacterium]